MNILFIGDIILVILALICLVVGSYTDFKKREVANWASFSLLIIAVVIRGIVSIFLANGFFSIIMTFLLLLLFLFGFFIYLRSTKPWIEYVIAILFILVWYLFGHYLFSISPYFISCFLTFGIFMILTNIMYYGKMSGGADVKILLALSVVFATTPVFLEQAYNLFIPALGFMPHYFLFDFFVNSLFIGLVFGILFSVFMALKNKKVFSEKFKTVFKKYLVLGIIMVLLGIVFLVFSSKINFLVVFGIFLIVVPFLLVFVSSVQESSMKRYKSWKELTEGDWLVESVKLGKKLIKPSADGLTKQDILLIKKAGKKVLVLDGMPFVPVFLISVIISLIFGNLLFLLLEILI